MDGGTPPCSCTPSTLVAFVTPRVATPCRVLQQAGVAMASAGELSFNWTGFLTAMASNLTFGFRAVWSKMWVVAVAEVGHGGCMLPGHHPVSRR
jgi:hypothetical protein